MDYAEHGAELQRFADFRPTQFDVSGLGSEGQEDWRVLPVIQTRDSGPLDRSNFAAALAVVEEVDPEGENHEVHRFGHWGPGWFEVIVVRPTEAMLTVAGEIVCALSNYPILDEDAYYELETEEAWEAWTDWGYSDWVRALTPYLHEKTIAWLEDATSDERDAVLRAVDEHSGSYWGHGEEYHTHREHAERCTRAELAALIRGMRQLRREKGE